MVVGERRARRTSCSGGGAQPVFPDPVAAGGMIRFFVGERRNIFECMIMITPRYSVSVSESILIRWLNCHYWKINSVEKRFPDRLITNFDTDFQDMVVFAHGLQSHFGQHVANALMSLKYPCLTPDHILNDTDCVIQALMDIQLAFPLPIQDQDTNPRETFLFAFFFFQNLPHYAPKTTIVFPATLGVNLTKAIELTNPAKKTVTYTALMRGSKNFLIKGDTVKIEPKMVHKFPVEFLSRFSLQSDAQLTFVSRREGNVHVAAISFDLMSKFIKEMSKKIVRQRAVVYEVGTEDIEVRNLMGAFCWTFGRWGEHRRTTLNHHLNVAVC